MIGHIIFNKIKITKKNENILYFGTSKFFKISYIEEQMEYKKLNTIYDFSRKKNEKRENK